MTVDVVCRASQEMEKVRKTATSEVARLEAALKKAELKIHGLDRSLEQKVKIKIWRIEEIYSEMAKFNIFNTVLMN